MQYFDLEKHPDGVAIVWLDRKDEKVNIITPSMIEECAAVFDDIEKDAFG